MCLPPWYKQCRDSLSFEFPYDLIHFIYLESLMLYALMETSNKWNYLACVLFDHLAHITALYTIIFFCFRDGRNNRVALFDGIEEGGIRASSLYSTSSHEIDEHDNEQALEGLQDRVNLLKRVSLLLLLMSCYLFCSELKGKLYCTN